MRVLIYFTMLFSTIITNAQMFRDKDFMHTTEIKTIAFSKDGNIAVSASKDKSLKLWNIKKGIGIKALDTTNTVVSGIKIFPKNNKIALGFITGSVIILDIDSNKTIQTYNPDELNYISMLDISDDEQNILIIHKNEIKIWNLENDTILYLKNENNYEIVSSMFLPNSNSKILLSQRNNLNESVCEILDLNKNTSEIMYTNNHIITSFSFVDSTKILLATKNGSILLYNILKKNIEHVFDEMFATEICAISVAQDKEYFVTGTVDGESTFWNLKNMEETMRTENKSSKVSEINFNNSEVLIYYSSGILIARNYKSMSGLRMIYLKKS